MILMWLWSAKDRHHSVALRLVDDALVSTHGLFHEIQNGSKPPHSYFGVTQTVDQSSGIADVRKENCQSLPLAPFLMERVRDVLPELIGGFSSLGF